MMDERSKNMRKTLESIGTYTGNGTSQKIPPPPPGGVLIIKPVPTMGYIPKRCLCCGGIGINHDE